MRGLALFLVLFLITCNQFKMSTGMLEWLFGDSGGDGVGSSADEAKQGDVIRFEVLSSDEKFLDFAQTLNDLSPLDACYNIVIYTLKKKCGELTEEELGKLSVQLLNCQSEAEDRPVFPCTHSMTLADCTKSMDGTTWNSYQIVGNRARAMCYATQQNQFRRLTEMTVNHLVAAAGNQLKFMDDLKSGQEKLHVLTSDTVRQLTDSQQDLLSTQNSLKAAHDDIFKHISTNVKEILQEKALIAAGNRELAMLTENIKEKLDSTSVQIREREEEEHRKHERILKDLRDIQDSTEISVKKLDHNLKDLLAKYQGLGEQFSSLSSNLRRMNQTMTYVMAAVGTLQTHLDDRISWISQLLGGADTKLSAISCCLLHMAYFFLLVVTATFLQVSLSVRLAMMVVVVGNVAAELNYDHSLDFAGLTVFLCSVYFGFKLLVWTKEKFGVDRARCFSILRPSFRVGPSGDMGGGGGLSAHEVKTLMELIKKFSNSINNRTWASPSNGSAVHDRSFRPATPPSGLTIPRDDSPDRLDDSQFEDQLEERAPLFPTVRGRNSRASSRTGTPLRNESRSSTPTISSRCLAYTVAGTQCRLPAFDGHDFCRLHAARR